MSDVLQGIQLPKECEISNCRDKKIKLPEDDADEKDCQNFDVSRNNTKIVISYK